MTRQTALTVEERKSWGGSTWNFLNHAAMFKTYQPYNFGVKTAQLFSSKPGSYIINKKFTYMTIAQGNVYMLPGGVDDYQWSLVANSYVQATITELLVDASSHPGKGGVTFKVAIDQDWYHEPTLFKTEGSNIPLMKVIGHPIQRSANSFEYEIEVQGGPDAYVPVEYLQPGRFLIDIATSVADEGNTKYAGDQYSQMFKLQSWVGNVARKVVISDKFIRAEIAARKGGTAVKGMGNYNAENCGVGVGYVYAQNFGSGVTGEKISRGVFITKAEARLLELVERDREMLMEFGQTQHTNDHDTESSIKVAPGWRQIVKDGHYMQHNGSLTLSDIFQYLMTIFLGRSDFNDRYIRIATGEAGAVLFDTLVKAQASSILTLDTMFINKEQSVYNSNSLAFGAQFTKWRAPNGVVVELVYDPVKDNKQLFPELAPGTSNYTLESFAFDIFDFGMTDQKASGASRDENITMVMQDGVESYFTISNVYDFETGAEKSGGQVYNFNKDASINREMSGSLCVWDVSRIGRIEYTPATSL